jgi:hypothetical protein
MQTKLQKLIHMNFHIKINFTHEDVKFFLLIHSKARGGKEKIYIQNIAKFYVFIRCCAREKTLNITRMENLLKLTTLLVLCVRRKNFLFF